MKQSFSPCAWAHPAFASVAPYAERLAAHRDWPSVDALDALFRDRLAIEPAVALETQEPRRRRAGARRDAVYEVRIHALRRIPTRPGSWHDLMNLLVWCAFPRSKRALTARQHGIVAGRVAADADVLPAARTREQDALAMLDEGGAILSLAARPEIVVEDARQVRAAVADGRAALHLFGHALLEAIALGELERRDLRCAIRVVPLDGPPTLEALDEDLARQIADPSQLCAPERERSMWLREIFA